MTPKNYPFGCCGMTEDSTWDDVFGNIDHLGRNAYCTHIRGECGKEMSDTCPCRVCGSTGATDCEACGEDRCREVA
ncbi:MAG: hypothetical protein FWH21_00885 [Kiritimatiellaeota bacterium]|nr:hypothetical protein [Kiritimatiellota bacterium]